jgi:hypothetical protein
MPALPGWIGAVSSFWAQDDGPGAGLLDRSALYGVLAEIEALGLDLLELRKLTPDRESPGSGHHRSP